jgi:hypothetical protein
MQTELPQVHETAPMLMQEIATKTEVYTNDSLSLARSFSLLFCSCSFFPKIRMKKQQSLQVKELARTDAEESTKRSAELHGRLKLPERKEKQQWSDSRSKRRRKKGGKKKRRE